MNFKTGGLTHLFPVRSGAKGSDCQSTHKLNEDQWNCEAPKGNPKELFGTRLFGHGDRKVSSEPDPSNPMATYQHLFTQMTAMIDKEMRTHAYPTMAQPNVRTPAASTGPLGPQAPAWEVHVLGRSARRDQKSAVAERKSANSREAGEKIKIRTSEQGNQQTFHKGG